MSTGCSSASDIHLRQPSVLDIVLPPSQSTPRWGISFSLRARPRGGAAFLTCPLFAEWWSATNESHLTRSGLRASSTDTHHGGSPILEVHVPFAWSSLDSESFQVSKECSSVQDVYSYRLSPAELMNLRKKQTLALLIVDRLEC